MALFVLDNETSFPPVYLAEPDGLLAIGGDLSPDRLLDAYRKGIFPWYEFPPVLWWGPDPRFVLFPDELKISKSMSALLKRKEFEFTINKAFDEVIHSCKTAARKGQEGTWITDEIEAAYKKLHRLGYAESAEVWKEGKLEGGLYGIRLGKVFFGESMFSRQRNASKFAFIRYVDYLKSNLVELIDCQVYTSHLESFGARFIDRKAFTDLLQNLVPR